MLVIYYVEDEAKMAKFNGADAFLRKTKQKSYDLLRDSDEVIIIDRNFRTDKGLPFSEAQGLVETLCGSNSKFTLPSKNFKPLEWWKESIQEVLDRKGLPYQADDVIWEMDLYFLGVDDLEQFQVDGAIMDAILDYEEAQRQKKELAGC